MSGTNTVRMLRAYQQFASVIMFLSGFFQSPAENFYNSESVEIDIVRGDEDIAIVIQDMKTGYRYNSTDLYTNKQFTAPIFKEAIGLNSFELIKRMPGQDPFQNPDFRANIIKRMFSGMQRIEAKIRRSVELQSAQVLQTGTVTLSDSNGVALYTLDYKPKTTHFPTAGTTWGQVGADPIGDMLALDEVINDDGLGFPLIKLIGLAAYEALISDSKIVERLNFRRADTVNIVPLTARGGGGKFRGTIDIGNNRSEIWTYNGKYKHPQTGAKTPYINSGSVISMSEGMRLDATFGAIPNIGRELGITGANLVPELPTRFANEAGGMDLFTNIWLSEDGESLFGGIGTRPLMIPTAIDQYGCLDTGL